MKATVSRVSRTCLAIKFALLPLLLWGQSASTTPLPPEPLTMIDASSFSADLPDAPSVAGSAPSVVHTLPDVHPLVARLAPKYADTIEPGYTAQREPVSGKMALAATELASTHYVAGALIAAGYSHLVQSNPKYGSNSEAFAQRAGAAAARGASQIVFSKAILAPVLHEDTRYYVLGPNHRATTRFLYAASRVFITRSDNGHDTLYVAQLVGYGGSAGLTQLYYPPGSRGLSAMLTGYGASMGGLAAQDELIEFVRFLTRGQPR